MGCLRRKQLNKLIVDSLWFIVYRKKLFKIILLSAIGYQLSAGYCFAGETLRAHITADNVNVRVRPEINSEIITQLSADEDVVVLEKGKEWTKIAAPGHSRCWVNSGCISESIIAKRETNLRCGPGLAFPVLTRLDKGTRVKIIEVFGEWTRVEPPVEFGVWISSKYLKYGDEAEEEPEEREEIKDEPFAEAEAPVEKPKSVSVAEEEISGVELVSFAGRLEDLGIIINRPGTYKIVSEKDKWECIIRSPTLDINPYVNRIVRIDGVLLSRKSSWGVPVVEVKKLQVIR